MTNLIVFLGVVGPWQVILIILAFLVFFGGKKIPELMKGIGQGLKEFKKATRDEPSEPEEKKEINNK